MSIVSALKHLADELEASTGDGEEVSMRVSVHAHMALHRELLSGRRGGLKEITPADASIAAQIPAVRVNCGDVSFLVEAG